ncbi:MAG: hypothetical protein WBI07_00025 [Mobilitalea sp.]
MKAIIMDIKDGFCAAFSDDGCITKVKNSNFEIGQVIEITNKSIPITRKFALRAASIAAVFIIGGSTTWAYATPYSHVSLDVNPSIEYAVNIFDRVIGVTAINDDGQDILDKINLHNINHLSIEDAISKTVTIIADNGYFSSETPEDSSADTNSNINIEDSTKIDGGIVISTSSKSKKKAEKLADVLEASVEAQLDENGDKVVLEVVSVDQERVQRAEELGITAGKLELIEKLQRSAENPEDIIIEEWVDQPVKEIMKETNENRKAAKESKTNVSKKSDTKTKDSKNSDQSANDIDAKAQQFNTDNQMLQPESSRTHNGAVPTIAPDNYSSKENKDRIKNNLSEQKTENKTDQSSQHDNNKAFQQQQSEEESDTIDAIDGIQNNSDVSPIIDDSNIVSKWKTSDKIKQSEQKEQEQTEQITEQESAQKTKRKAEQKAEQIAKKIAAQEEEKESELKAEKESAQEESKNQSKKQKK